MTYQVGPIITEAQKQILYGTILGGSSIIRPNNGKNYYLAMRGSNKIWLNYKIEELKCFFKIDENTIKKDKNTYRCYSVAYPVFHEVQKLFYKNNSKIIQKETLEILTENAWMVWFVDAGRKDRKKCYLRTHKFGEEGSKIIANYFTSLDCDCKNQKNRGRNEIVFSEKGSVELLNIIKDCLPDFINTR